MPAKNNLIQGVQTIKITIADIIDCDEKKVINSDLTIEFPFIIKYNLSNGKVGLQARTTGSITAKNWEKKFYLNSKGYTSFTRDSDLLAICKIKEAKGETIDYPFDVNSLIGFTFEGVYREIDGVDGWIDWTSTFEVNGVAVPNLKPAVVTKSEDGVIDSNDLPF